MQFLDLQAAQGAAVNRPPMASLAMPGLNNEGEKPGFSVCMSTIQCLSLMHSANALSELKNGLRGSALLCQAGGASVAAVAGVAAAEYILHSEGGGALVLRCDLAW